MDADEPRHARGRHGLMAARRYRIRKDKGKIVRQRLTDGSLQCGGLGEFDAND